MSLKIDLKIFALLILFYFTNQLEIYLMLMIFAIIHELGHLLVGLTLGQKPKEIKINPFGLSILFKFNVDEYNRKIKNGNELELKKIFIAFAGPITNILLIIIASITRIDEFMRTLIIASNVVIASFNLLPIYPLDGGRIVKGILHIFLGKHNSEKMVNDISIIVTIILTFIASIAIYYFKNISIFLITIYVWYLVLKENKIYKSKKEMYDVVESIKYNDYVDKNDYIC